MKKNLLSIIILFLLIINISLTAVLVFTLVVTNQRALSLMTDVATVLKLELPVGGVTGEFVAPDVPIADVTTYDVAAGEPMTILVKRGPEDENDRYVNVRVSLSMDSRNRGYRDNNGPDLSPVDVMIQDRINGVFGRYTIDDARNSEILEQIKIDIILSLHQMYGSDFIFNISFRDIRYF